MTGISGNGLLAVAHGLTDNAWVGLLTSGPSPVDTAAGTEATGYTRVQLTSWSYTLVYPNVTVAQTADVTITPAPNATVTGWVLFSAVTGGNRLFSDVFPFPIVLDNTQNLVVPAGTIQFVLGIT